MPYGLGYGGLYNLPELQRQGVGLTTRIGGPGQVGQAVNAYGRLRADALKTQMARQLEYQRLANAARMNTLRYQNSKFATSLMNKRLRMKRRQLRQDKKAFPLNILTGLGTSLFSVYEGNRRAKRIKEQSAMHNALMRQILERNK